MILGEDKSKFPSGNALFINLKENKILIDTNPSEKRINSFLKNELNLSSADITDVILSHTHLDHGRGLAAIFEKSNAMIHAHPDTLKRCEKKARIGLYAGIQKEQIHHFEAFGSSIGFKDRSYPYNRKHPLKSNQTIQLGEISIYTHETNAHCLHMLDYEIRNDKFDLIFSCDYDFTPVPWYGVPQRGYAVQRFKDATKELVHRKVQSIISSHRLNPIPLTEQQSELEKYLQTINERTKRAINMIPSRTPIKLQDISNFVYPIEKMAGAYSEDYIICAQTWDYWLLLAHLEEAWQRSKVKCIESDGDLFLERCIEADQYLTEEVEHLLVNGWAEETLQQKMPFHLPANSVWKKL
ncbi:MAG: hypothetical protein BAJALOKI1v1_1650001 [Promethearchaeota archaeon]|nr:MAG: hypothetical protein BAJALOKI1v1_1650001 [Candidatus Lokiarchaeota archaeon]